jgi:hypothetical protein
MSSGKEFSTQENGWPEDTEEYVFLDRAIDKVGTFLFGDRWRRDEPAVHAAHRQIAQWCTSGMLKSALRPDPGNDFFPLSPTSWSRFDELSQADSVKTAFQGSSSPGGHIFVTRDDLNRLIVRARDQIAGPFDEPPDGTISLRDLVHWITTLGRQRLLIEVSDEAIGSAELLIGAAHREGRIALLGVCIAPQTAKSLGRELNAGPPRPIPTDYLANPILGLEANLIGYRRASGVTPDWVWAEVCVSKADVRWEWPFQSATKQSSTASMKRAAVGGQAANTKSASRSLANEDQKRISQIAELNTPSSGAVRKRRGRRAGSTKMPWRAFEDEARRRLELEGPLNSKDGWYESILLNQMLEWTTNPGGWDTEPSPTEARKHIQKAVAEYERGKAELPIKRN